MLPIPERSHPQPGSQRTHSKLSNEVGAPEAKNPPNIIKINEEAGLERGCGVAAQLGASCSSQQPKGHEEERPAFTRGCGCFPACTVPASWLPNEALKCK